MRDAASDETSDLSDQYDTAKQIPGGDVAPYFASFDAASERARTSLRVERDLRYGTHERETFDYFPSHEAGAPLFVWVHGGYWRRLSKDQFSFVAPPLVAAGAAVAVLNYPLAPGPSLDEIVASVARGYEAAVAHAARCDADVARAFVGGHSVGAQLAGTLAARYDVRGMLALSGLYDLEPLLRTHVNAWIAMDAASARRNSPVRLRPRTAGTLVASVGGLEQAEFQRQQRLYVDAWRAWGGSAIEIDAKAFNHFDIVLELDDSGSPLARALRAMMALD